MTKLKICGLRDAEHALVAADEGADFLGFNFVPGVRRQLTEEQARSIIAAYRRERGAGGPRLVGLFADQPLDEVNAIVRGCGLDLAQLCGSEPLEYWQGVAVPIIRQVKVRDDGSGRQSIAADTLQRVEEVVSDGHTPLLDKYEKGAFGGTGRSFDWRLAREVAERHDVVLAGGLTPENVGRAITEAAPWGVDVSSGVETDGVQDAAKIERFAKAVRHADGGGAESRSRDRTSD